jgi:predicted metal-dependent phosphoesterase TrpH
MKKTLALTSALAGLFALAVLVAAHSAGPAAAVEPTPPGPSASDSAAAPVIVFTNPSVGARAVPTHTLVSATFNVDMDPSTITGSTFIVSQGATPVVGSIGYITMSQVAVFQPIAPLAPDTVYTATVTTGVRSRSGEPLAANVVWAFTTADGTSPLDGGMHVYFGDLHSHSAYSDGKGTPADAFATARANGLDFFALTDHSSQLTAAEWQDVLDRANAATVNGQFVGLRGFEYTNPGGHINVFDTATYVSETNPSYDTFAEFYAWLGGQPTAIGQFNHPYKSPSLNWNFNDFAYDAAAASKMRLREPGYSSDQYLLGLNAGWQVGAVDSSDTHQANWGRWRYMGVVAPSLTRDAILEALQARRTFSAPDRNVAVVMQANGYWMGSLIPYTSTIHFAVTVYDPDPTEALLTLVLYDNGVPVIASNPLTKTVSCHWSTSMAGTPGHYYYVKAYYDFDTWSIAAYTSPVWMARPGIPRQFLPLIGREDAGGGG